MAENGQVDGPFHAGEVLRAAKMNDAVRSNTPNGILHVAPPLFGQRTAKGWVLSADEQRVVIFKKTSDTPDADGLKPGKIYRFEVGNPTPEEVEDCLIWELP